MILLYSFSNDTSVTRIFSYQESGKTSNQVQGNAFFYAGCQPCDFAGPQIFKTTAQTAISVTEKFNECGGSSFTQSCNNNLCATNAKYGEKEIGDVWAPRFSKTASQAITCAPALSSKQTSTQSPFSGKATVYCLTKGKGTISIGGTFEKEPVLSCAKYVVNAIAVPGFGLPMTMLYGKDLTYKNECKTVENPIITVEKEPHYYSSQDYECAKLDQYWNLGLVMAGCEYFTHFTKPGKYINSSTNLSGFSSFSPSIASGQTLTINSKTAKFGSADTFNYTNKELTGTILTLDYADDAPFTFIYIQSSELKSGTYNAWTGKFNSTTNKFYESEKMDCTYTEEFSPKKPCESAAPEPKTTTITEYAGLSWESKCAYVAGVPVGSFFANDILTATRTSALVFKDFDYSLNIKNDGSSKTQTVADMECVSQKEVVKQTMEYPAVAPCEHNPDIVCYAGPCTPKGTNFDGASWPQSTFDKYDINVVCGNGCDVQTNNCTASSTYDIFTTKKCPATECGDYPEIVAPLVPCDGYMCLAKVPMNYTEYEADTVEQKAQLATTCDIGYTMEAGQSITRRVFDQTFTASFAGKIYRKAIQPFGIFVATGKTPEWLTTFSISGKESVINSSHIVPYVFAPAKYGYAYAPPASGISITKQGETTFIAFSTASSNPNSYLVSSSTAKIVERAHWDGFGMFRGPFKSGTFQISFSGVKSNTIAGNESRMAYLPFAKQTFVCDGGLNVINSKQGATDKISSSVQTKAFSTSFDSTFAGFFQVKNVPFYSCATAPDNNGYINFVQQGEDVDDNCNNSMSCIETGFNEIVNRLKTIKETSTYLIQGDTSKLYQSNSISYFWTDPAKYQVYGTGHTCE